MKNIYLLLFSLIAIAFTACQQDDLDVSYEVPSGNSDAVPVKISFSVEPGVETSTGYEPMKSAISPLADEEVRVKISNQQRVIIAKKIDNRWVFETTVDFMIDPDDRTGRLQHEITRSTILGPFTIQLTPGEYKATVITGVRNTVWYDHNLQKGDLLGYTDGTPFKAPPACTYIRISGQGYLNIGSYGLGEEIFADSVNFEVKKTEDLHSTVYPNSVNLTLKRKVSKFRVLLQCDPNLPSGGDLNTREFYYNHTNGISALLETGAATPFCNGLDVWGQPYYNTEEVLTELPYGVFTVQHLRTGSNGSSYSMGMSNTRQFSCYYFSDPDQDVPITITKASVQPHDGSPQNTYYDDDITGLVIRHNQMTGIIFKCGVSINQADTERSMELVRNDDGTPSLSTDKFSFPYEYITVTAP